MTKQMISKFPGTCRDCGARVPRGASIVYHGKGRGISCASCSHTFREVPPGPVGPCWECKDPAGFFRSYGAATPVYCDNCEKTIRARQFKVGNVSIDLPEDEALRDEDDAAGLEPGTLESDRRLSRAGISVVRFSSGESYTRNSRGRCEDAPCCGCCTF